MANNYNGQRNNGPKNGYNNNGANRNTFGRTRAGIEADFSEGFNLQPIPCSKMAQHINELVRTVVNAYNEKAEKVGADQLNIQGQAFIIPMEFSKKFAPCIIVIPDDWVLTAESLKGEDEYGEFYTGRDEDDDKVISLQPIIRDIISKFMYSKKDEQCFFSSMWRKEHDISSSTAIKLKNLRPCKRQTLAPNKYGQKSIIHCLIDPARLIHDMVVNPDKPDEDFRIINLHYSKKGKKQGTYKCTKKYVSSRDASRNNKEYANAIAQILKNEFNNNKNNNGGQKNFNKDDLSYKNNSYNEKKKPTINRHKY